MLKNSPSRRSIRARLSFSSLVSLLALFIALGGASWAAVTLPSHSVGTRQLQHDAVTSPKVRNHSLLAEDFKNGELPAGRPGPTGPAGTAGAKGDNGRPGPKGDPGTSGATNVVVRTQSALDGANGGRIRFLVQCLPGERAVGGGANLDGTTPVLEESFPAGDGGVHLAPGDTPTLWESLIRNDGGLTATATGYAVCAAP